jgi:di/tricarboxylate transporter
MHSASYLLLIASLKLCVHTCRTVSAGVLQGLSHLHTLINTIIYQLTLFLHCLHTLLCHCYAAAVMLGWVTSEEVDMVQAAMAAIAALLITGAIEARKAVSYVDWGLLLLIGSAIGLSQAMSNSGLARYIGKLRTMSSLTLNAASTAAATVAAHHQQ